MSLVAGPYVSVWDAGLQREVYGSAWGMTKDNEANLGGLASGIYFVEKKKVVKLR